MKRRIKEEYLAMLENTVAYYSENPKERRAVQGNDDSPSNCVYSSDTGQHCAVGRWIDYDVFDLAEFNEATAVEDIFDYYDNNEEDIFVPEARGYALAFWQNLQYLHDKKQNWTDTGLSEEGEAAKQKIIEKINANHYLFADNF
jgi:hypothetical protein